MHCLRNMEVFTDSCFSLEILKDSSQKWFIVYCLYVVYVFVVLLIRAFLLRWNEVLLNLWCSQCKINIYKLNNNFFSRNHDTEDSQTVVSNFKIQAIFYQTATRRQRATVMAQRKWHYCWHAVAQLQKKLKLPKNIYI